MRALLAAVLLAVTPVWAAEHGASSTMLFRTINFLILAGGLGYLIKKKAPALFAARDEEIRRGMAEARQLLEESERRAAAIESRLAGLDREIAGLRQQARAEMEAERARLDREGEQRVRKVFAQAEQEMAAAAKAARLELRAYAASLAVGLAERRIAGQLSPGTQRALLEEFARGLQGKAA